MVLEITGPPILVVMGVAGTGKSTVAGLLAERLNWELQEGDDLHPPANVAKMSAGIPLDDQDRWPWLDCLDSEQAGTRRTRTRHLLRSETQLSRSAPGTKCDLRLPQRTASGDRGSDCEPKKPLHAALTARLAACDAGAADFG